MIRRNRIVFISILALFILALAVVFPIHKGLLFNKDVRLGLDLQGGTHLEYQADLSKVKAGEAGNAIDSAMAILQARINPLGVTEPLIQKKGSDEIVVELPGVSITDKEKQDLSQVTPLQFGVLVTDNGSYKWQNQFGKWRPAVGVVNGQVLPLTSAYFKQNSYVKQSTDPTQGGVEIAFQWDSIGSQLSQQITSNLSKTQAPLGIFEGDNSLLGQDGQPIAPRVQSTIVDSGVIQGLSLADANRLSAQLNAGRLPVPLKIVFDQRISPRMGADFVTKSVKAGLIGVLMVMIFMIVYYRFSGLLASISLLFYGSLVMALFKLVPVTLTLAGLGGFILSIGMAVDANVLIFERIKEELRDGRTLGAAVEAGFNRAWSAIRDGNLTTIIVCIVLFWVGNTVASGAPVKGFASTLFVGVIVSMFTAIIGTRTLLRLFVRTSLVERPELFAPHLGKKAED